MLTNSRRVAVLELVTTKPAMSRVAPYKDEQMYQGCTSNEVDLIH